MGAKRKTSENKRWIQGAIKRKGALRKKAGVKKGQKIPESVLNRLAKQKGRTGKQARLAKTLKKFKKRRRR